MVPQDNVSIPERSGESRISRAEDRNHRHSEQGRKMHRPGIIRMQQEAFSQFTDQLIQRRMANPIHTLIADRSRDPIANCRVLLCSK